MTATSTWLALTVLLGVASCGHAEARVSASTLPPASATRTPAAPTAKASTPLCHPIVSGCGCAYQCAQGFRSTAPAHWQVTHDLQDNRLDDTTIQTWCFDAAGHGQQAAGASVDATRCLEVFFDGTPCGGECLPTTAYLGCHASGDRCVE